MKAIVDGYRVEGTPKEIAEFVYLSKPHYTTQTIEPVIANWSEPFSKLKPPRPEANCTVPGHQHKAKECKGRK